jgi:hypothetical protein
MIELAINGCVDLIIYKDDEEISEKEYTEVYSKLNKGKLFISLDKKTIVSIDDFQKILYTFDIEVGDAREDVFDLPLPF